MKTSALYDLTRTFTSYAPLKVRKLSNRCVALRAFLRGPLLTLSPPLSLQSQEFLRNETVKQLQMKLKLRSLVDTLHNA
jgi:hypothetical protein